MADLERFDRLAVGRERRMIELKREVNEMASKAGVKPPYGLSFTRSDERVPMIRVSHRSLNPQRPLVVPQAYDRS